MLPLSIRVTGRAATCILDGELALSPLGLLFALRTARDMNCWLVRRLWSLLDDKAYRCEELDLYEGERERQGALTQASAEMLGEWWCAWLNGDLTGSFSWVGDAKHEHALPEGTDAHLVSRFELLAQELDLRLGRCNDAVSATPRSDCARDALALAAALAVESPVIFTTLAADAEEPLVCAQAGRAGVAARQLARRPGAQLSDALVAPWMRPGLIQLSLAGLNAVAVHVVAPRALAFDPSQLADDGWRDDAAGQAGGNGDLSGLWDGASVLWHRLGWE